MVCAESPKLHFAPRFVVATRCPAKKFASCTASSASSTANSCDCDDNRCASAAAIVSAPIVVVIVVVVRCFPVLV